MNPFRYVLIVASTLQCLALVSCASQPKPAAKAEPTSGNETKEAPPAMPEFTLSGLAKGAVLLPDLGTHRRSVTTKAPAAQAFFDQGLALTFGFNHDEAARSFAKAAELDPTCALCFWGAALTLGPNYNIPMLPDRARAAWEAIGAAQAQASAATPVEQALIAALAQRYKGPEYLDPVAMAPFNQAYADAMRGVAQKFPEDLDVQVLYAEALMNLNPWKLWTTDGKPAPGTEEIVKALEGVLAKKPEHPGANHYYIHAVEASKSPERAIASADRLAALMPGAGHIVHMPAHIYQRVGRYADASKANEAAIVSDEAYLKAVTPPGYYPFYLGHNHGFLAFSASMEGRSADALSAARKSAETIPKDIVCGMPGMDFFLAEPLLVMVRFGRFDEILREPKPEAKYAMLSALWHHSQGMALAGTGKLDEARAQAAAIREIAKAIPEEMLAGMSTGKQLLELSAKAVEARVADAEKKPEAAALWQAAVEIEDQLAYNEPADWFYPTRHYLGAALLDAGKAKDAEAVYRADLKKNPKNGWALYGLWQALMAQKRNKDAKAAEKDFRAAWSKADFELKRSAF